MSSQPTSNLSSGDQLLNRLAANSKQVAIGLIVAGLVLGFLIAGINFYLYKLGSLTTATWGILVGVFLISVGLVYLLVCTTETTATPEKNANNLRLVLLAVSAGLGLLTAIYGLALAMSEPPGFAMMDYRKILAGGIKAWRDPTNNHENAWALVRCIGALVFGLVLMFAGLNLARTFERTSQGLRRLLYGYNAVLSSLLIGFILLLLNAVSYSNVQPFKALGTTYDWTGAKMYSLSESTENLLTNLKEPVTVYLLLSRNNPISVDAEALLNTCRQSTEQLSWESLSPESNRSQVAELAEKYGLSNPRGMLVVYGREGSQTWDFTKQEDLQAPDPKNQAGLGYIFKGEEYLQKSLIYLTQNKTKTQVYFAQGHGEPEISNHTPEPGRGGLGSLTDELRKRNYEIHDLKMGPAFKEVPRDADIVVIVDPREAYSSKEVSVLRDYLQGRGHGKKGHLMYLAGVHVKDGRMLRTGLEELLAEYGVRVQDDRLLQLGAAAEEGLLLVRGNTNSQSNNPVARAFNPQGAAPINFGFDDTRTVEKLERPGGSFTVDTLIVARNQLLVRMSDLSERPRDTYRDLMRHPEELQRRMITEPVPLAATVSEGNPLSRIPGHEGMGGEGERPRLVVFGDANWVSNFYIAGTGRLGLNHADLFASCLAWLRERPDIGANVTTHERQYFQINMPSGSARWRLLLLPVSLLLVAVLAMGLGVWVVRRR